MYSAIREHKTPTTGFKSGDILVLFGELFNRGYANGLVDEAKRMGLQIIYTTVGRREKDGTLRKLQPEEISAENQPLINIPLEAGFDMEPNHEGISPVQALKDVKLNDWESFSYKAAQYEQSRAQGRKRFAHNTRLVLAEIKKHLKPNQNVIFAHLMAGGVPRAKIVLPLMNRALKGIGERYLASEKMWNSDIGQFVAQSFFEVTAETFRILVEESSDFRKTVSDLGGQVSYTAYGYHGTEILIDNNYEWQTYTPYLQGWAKVRLENYSREFYHKNIRTCVYNCPEILTNSSAIFTGVEMSLYPLMNALLKDGSPEGKQLVADCIALLKPEHTLAEISKFIKDYVHSDVIRSCSDIVIWPQHSTKEQLEKMLTASEYLHLLHKDEKKTMAPLLSEWVLKKAGKIMLQDAFAPTAAVSWINHDILAKA